MPTAVVTGANSGIGHAFAKVLLNAGYHVHAVDITDGDGLQALRSLPSATSARCTTSQLDVTSPDSIQAFKHAHFSNDSSQPLDLLLNVAGITDPPDRDTLTTVTHAALTRVFSVNAFGPLLLVQALLPNVLQSSSPTTRLAFVSSRVGSIADNATGGSYAYRASKTALNQIAKTVAVELRDKGVVVSILHPGIVRTNILGADTGAGMKDAVEPEEAAGKLFEVLRGKGIEETGRFWHREGYELPW